MRMSRVAKGWALCLFLCTAEYAHGQLSAPISHDDHISIDGNKFLQNKAELDAPGVLVEEDLPYKTCPQNVELKWSTEVSSSIYATPLITDLYSDGRKDIIVPSFVHYLEVLEGDNGAQAVGWPAFHRSTIHASPLMYDIDLDGVQDILLTTYNGEVLFFKDTGEQLWGSGLTIPRLRVRKYWFRGLNPDPNNRDNTGMGNWEEGDAAHQPPAPASGRVVNSPVGGSGAPQPLTEQVAMQLVNYRKKMVEYRDKYGDVALRQLLDETHSVNPAFFGLLMKQLTEEGLVGKDGKVHLPPTAPSPPPTQPATGTGTVSSPVATPTTTGRRLMQAPGGDGVEAGPGGQGGLTDEAAHSFDVFDDEAYHTQGDDDDAGADVDDADQGADQAGAAEGGADAHYTLDDEAAYNDADMVEEAKEEEAAAGGQQQQGGAGGQQGAAIHEQQHERRPYDFWGDDGDEEYPYHELFNKKEQQQLGGLTTEYDELGDRYEVGNAEVKAEQEEAAEAKNDKAAAERAAFIKDLTSSIDMTSMDEAEDANNALNYHHLYEGDYEALAAARDKVLNRFWKTEDFTQASHQSDQEYVYVDAHVLATPALGDIDADGHEELVIPVSYFYDREYYDHPDHRHELGEALDLGKYIASGIVVYDLRTRLLKWTQHLDLSTDSTSLKAYVYATPTLADVDRDGRLEVVVGTSMGYLYVLDPAKGQPLNGWPVQMADVQGQALVMDINNDGHVEILAGDGRGNVAAFKASGEEVWARHVKSMISAGASAGDINNDGDLEIVFGTSSGHIYAVSGATGEDVKGFPFRTRGRIHAPALITRLLDGPAQHIIVPSFDGYMYLIDGLTACADTVDIGETSYSMVLAEDLDGNGQLDLLLSTMNGAVYAFATPAKYHPLKTWPAQVVGANCQLARHDLVGIYATASSRQPRDVAGDKLQIQVRLVDKRPVLASNGSVLTGQAGPYNISAVLRGVGVKEMGAGSQPVIGVADTVVAPGLYTLEVPTPRTRSSATVHLELMDGSGLTLSDDFSLSFHMHFHKLLKWVIAGPLVLMVLGLLAVSRSREAEEEEAGLSLPLATHAVEPRAHMM